MQDDQKVINLKIDPVITCAVNFLSYEPAELENWSCIKPSEFLKFEHSLELFQIEIV